MSQQLTVLAITRDKDALASISNVIGDEGHEIVSSEDLDESIQMLRNGLPVHLVLLDVSLCRGGCPQYFEALLRSISRHSICIISTMSDQSWKPFAAKFGIDSHVEKPLLRHELDALVTRYIAKLQRLSEDHIVTDAPAPSTPKAACHFEELEDGRYFLAGSPAMQEIYRQVLILAPVDVPVLILGESGVGKEVIASLLHKHSARSRQMFMNVNCAALPSELLESELFGYEKGAFTGAYKDKPGKFETATNGTLLLDEIGEMSATMQAKLLHVLQDGHFSRLGSQVSARTNVRILAATNVNIESAIETHHFREDLYYRLNAFTIRVPALRERREEIPLLMNEMLKRIPYENAHGIDRFPTELAEMAMNYSWPGNVRELSNFVTRTAILQDMPEALRELRHRVERQSFGSEPEPHLASSSVPPANNMRSIVRDIKEKTEMHLIQDALNAAGWNRRHAAQELNISYRALLYKIQRYKLNPIASSYLHP
ncbi:MAG: sigma 54-interacting transcriptional regulator [Acidobacteriaceae bacterium]